MPLFVTLAMLCQSTLAYQFGTPDPGPVVHAQAAPPPSPEAIVDRNDPYGFTTWLNATRRMYGLRPLAYDPSLELWARSNNLAQRERGEPGHFVWGPARRQNAAVITGDISPYIGAIWMDSDEHRPGLLDHTITRFGIAWDGYYWTWNAR